MGYSKTKGRDWKKWVPRLPGEDPYWDKVNAAGEGKGYSTIGKSVFPKF